MTELESMLEAANPVPETGPGSDVSVPPFEDVWAATQTPVKGRLTIPETAGEDTSGERLGRSRWPA